MCRELGLLHELISQVEPKDIVNRFPEIFSEIGKLKDFKCYITCKPEEVRFSCARRRLALSLLPDVKKELNNLIENDVTVKVNEPTDWCSPIVVVRKQNSSVRICCDYHKLNECISRQLFHLPTVEDLIASILDAKFLAMLDCNKAYHQIEVSEESRYFLTFGTPCGQYTSKEFLLA